MWFIGGVCSILLFCEVYWDYPMVDVHFFLIFCAVRILLMIEEDARCNHMDEAYSVICKTALEVAVSI